MNVILDLLPNGVEIGGNVYEVETDFRAWLDFTRILNKPAPEAEDVLKAFETVFIEQPINEDPEDIMASLVEFLADEDPKEKEKEPLKMADLVEDVKKKAVIDYDFDSGYIFSGFMQAYNIDLRFDDLHWYEFLALFNGLPKDCTIMEIIGYRSITPETYSKMSRAEKENVRKIQRAYALPDNRTQEEIDGDFANDL